MTAPIELETTPSSVTVWITVDTTKFEHDVAEFTSDFAHMVRVYNRMNLRAPDQNRQFLKYINLEDPKRTAMHAAYDRRRRARGRRRRNHG